MDCKPEEHFLIIIVPSLIPSDGRILKILVVTDRIMFYKYLLFIKASELNVLGIFKMFYISSYKIFYEVAIYCAYVLKLAHMHNK